MTAGLALMLVGCDTPETPTSIVDIDVPSTGAHGGDADGDVVFAGIGPVNTAGQLTEDASGEEDTLDVTVDVAPEVAPEPECEPDVYCVDGVAGLCTSAGLWVPSQDCGAEGLLCVGGSCRSPCEIEADDEGIAGCDHWGAGLAHGAEGPAAITALNVASVYATVAVWAQTEDQTEAAVVASATLAPGELRAFDLGEATVSAPGIHWAGWRLRATAPVIATQHSPLAGLNGTSSDGSLLLPAQGMGTEFIAAGRPEGRHMDGSPRRATLTIVAAEPGTQITLSPSVPLNAGESLGVLEAQALIGLQPHQVLHLTTVAEGDDPAGTILYATHPVAVFSGHEADPGAVSAPYGAPADHLEDALRPVSRWGRTHVLVKSVGHAGMADAAVIVAAEDHTLVQFDPPIQGDITLMRGEAATRAITASVVVTASRPVQVMQLTAGAEAMASPPPGTACVVDDQCATGHVCEDWTCALPTCEGALDTSCPEGHRCDCDKTECRCDPAGDAAWWVVPPMGQFEARTAFAAAITYPTHHVAIAVPPGAATPTLDEVSLGDALEAVGSAGWRVATVPVQSGPHLVDGESPVGVVVYGNGRDAGYGHAAGQALRDLRPEVCLEDSDCADPLNPCMGTAMCDTTQTPARCSLEGGTETNCPAPEGPCVFAYCDPDTGDCAQILAPDGVGCLSPAGPCARGVCEAGACVNAQLSCDDGVFCNGVEVCNPLTNICEPGPDPPVDDGLDCTLDSCNEALGVVVHTPQPWLCDDGLVCNGEELCDPEVGCAFQPTTICDDGVFCNGPEGCDDVSCFPGVPPEVDDGIPCTLDACNEAVGEVLHLPDHGQCDDGKPCTTDTCDPTKGCVFIPMNCDDGDACTIDSCDLNQGCVYEAVDCDDNDACTDDPCDSATGCEHVEIVCDDDDPCTPNFCLAATGCIFGATCDDNDACTIDGCDEAGECTTTPVDCEDGNPCTTDTCDVALGCSNVNLCDDGNACTEDTCAGSLCANEPVDCDDGDACTIESCDPLTGCDSTPVDCVDDDPCTEDLCDLQGQCSNPPLSCDDGDACTDDLCEGDGQCTHSTTDCDDGVDCTADSCHSVDGCANISPCDDALVCTVDICLPGGGCDWTSLDCDDDDPCTDDSCNNVEGCVHIDTCGGG